MHREPETLEAGEYDLRVEMLVLGEEATIEWAGYECPVKEIGIELRADGFRIRDGCPGEET
ncbi:hypothetical protein [Halovenus halobia]|uniref:hypothetical protein n=1 Tax=Halovenus halobia TaxID=3396622 RepID=UPI003F5593E9